MKKRLAIWAALISVASIATAASFHIPVKQLWTDVDHAKYLGISVDEYRKIGRMGCQLGSDVHNNRPIREGEVQYLIATAEQDPKLASRIMWNLRPLRETSYKSRVIELAFKLSQSKDENEAFVAIDTLKHFGDARWKGLAEAFPWQCKEYSELIMEPRRY